MLGHLRWYLAGALLMTGALLFQPLHKAHALTLSGVELRRLHGIFHAVWKNRHKATVQVFHNGTLRARSGPRVDVGRWKVRGNELCVSFKVWTRGRYKCGKVEKVGKWYVGLRKKDGTPRLKMRR